MNQIRKRIYIEAGIVTIISIVLLCYSIPHFHNAQRVNWINTPENFPDPYFREAVEKFMNVWPNGGFTAEEAAQQTGMMKIAAVNMKGIEFFPNITALTIYNSNLADTLDISNNRALEFLCVDTIALTKLDISSNTNLKVLSCQYTQLITLVCSNNPYLEHLYCTGNKLTHLDLSACKRLKTLHCADNLLTTLDFSNNPWLREVDSKNNQLSEIPEIPNYSTNPIHGLKVFDIRMNELDTDDWSDVLKYRERIGEPVFGSSRQASWGFACSPQKNFDPYEFK